MDLSGNFSNQEYCLKRLGFILLLTLYDPRYPAHKV
jgi:hypothetical protein